MRKILFAAAVAGALMLFGCGGGGASSGGTAFLRIAHVSPDTGPLDVELEDAPLTTLSFGGAFPVTNSKAKSVNSGFPPLTFLESGTSNIVFDLNPEFDGGHIYTYLVAGLSNGNASNALQPLVVDETISSLEPADTNIRFVNASTLMNAVDIYITNTTDAITTMTPTVSALPRYGVSSLLKILPGAYRIRICPAGSKTPTIDINNQTAVKGVYAVEVTENNSDNTGSVLAAYGGPF